MGIHAVSKQEVPSLASIGEDFGGDTETQGSSWPRHFS